MHTFPCCKKLDKHVNNRGHAQHSKNGHVKDLEMRLDNRTEMLQLEPEPDQKEALPLENFELESDQTESTKS
jgi:hypothetical protein